MRQLKTTIAPFIVGTLSMIKGTDKLINQIPDSPSPYEIEKNYTLKNSSSP